MCDLSSLFYLDLPFPTHPSKTKIKQGGYAESIVVDEAYALHIPDNLDLAAAAPLLCAGITVWSPYVHYNVRSHHSVGVVGLGGLGHMAVKFAAAMGCDVAVISTSPKKEALAKELGAHKFIVISDEEAKKANQFSLDYIIDTVSAPHKLSDYLPFLRTNGTLCLVGIPTKAYEIHASELLMKRLKLGGSIIGGIKETQVRTFSSRVLVSMLQYAAMAIRVLNYPPCSFLVDFLISKLNRPPPTSTGHA